MNSGLKSNSEMHGITFISNIILHSIPFYSIQLKNFFNYTCRCFWFNFFPQSIQGCLGILYFCYVFPYFTLKNGRESYSTTSTKALKVFPQRTQALSYQMVFSICTFFVLFSSHSRLVYKIFPRKSEGKSINLDHDCNKMNLKNQPSPIY